VIVIGAGPAGHHAALEAARLGFAVLLADPEAPPGAGSTLSGTIAASLLRAAGRGARPSAAEVVGLCEQRRRLVQEELRRAEQGLLAAGVRIVRGRARLEPSGEVAVEGQGVFAADHVVIASGSRPRRPPRFGFDDRVVCDSDSILRFEHGLPRSLVIVGAEVAGCEFACLFAALGASVTLVERRRRLLRCADPELLDLLHRELQALGVVVALEEEVEEVEVRRGPGEPHAVVRLGSGRSEVCDRLLVLAGREGAHPREELAAAGIEVDAQGFALVDDRFLTTRPGVRAIGDAAGPAQGSHVAPHQARIAMLHAAGREPPNCEFSITAHTRPELAVVGMIEEALKRLDLPYGVGRAEFSALPHGAPAGSPRGLLKLTYAREGRRLLGVQIIGPRASELIQIGAMMIESGGTIDHLIDQPYPHQSLSEVYRAAALAAQAGAENGAGAPLR
jgi:NAD(P) transhydrogenase